MKWLVFGVNEDDSREEVARFEKWEEVIEWMNYTWGNTFYYGLLIMPDDEMLELLKEGLNDSA